MVSTKNSNAMAEVIYYLKGIRQEDIDRIPKNFLQYLMIDFVLCLQLFMMMKLKIGNVMLKESGVYE